VSQVRSSLRAWSGNQALPARRERWTRSTSNRTPSSSSSRWRRPSCWPPPSCPSGGSSGAA